MSSQRIEEIINEVPDADKDRYCQYYTGDPKRYCSATSHKSCKRCRFFAPFITQKMEILADTVDKERSRISSLEGQITKLNKTIEWQKELLEHPDAGEWICEDGRYICPECGHEYRELLLMVRNYQLPNYCPDCGARLTSERKDKGNDAV